MPLKWELNREPTTNWKNIEGAGGWDAAADFWGYIVAAKNDLWRHRVSAGAWLQQLSRTI